MEKFNSPVMGVKSIYLNLFSTIGEIDFLCHAYHFCDLHTSFAHSIPNLHCFHIGFAHCIPDFHCVHTVLACCISNLLKLVFSSFFGYIVRSQVLFAGVAFAVLRFYWFSDVSWKTYARVKHQVHTVRDRICFKETMYIQALVCKSFTHYFIHFYIICSIVSAVNNLF